MTSDPTHLQTQAVSQARWMALPCFAIEKNNYPKWDHFYKLLKEKGVNNDAPDVFLPTCGLFLRFSPPNEQQQAFDAMLLDCGFTVQVVDNIAELRSILSDVKPKDNTKYFQEHTK